jgi:hypothetical protein
MDILIQFLSDILGIPYDTVEGSVATLTFLFCAFLLRLLWDASKRDNKQVDLEQMLARLAVRSLDSYDANTTTIEKNTAAIEEVVAVLKDMGTSFTSCVEEMAHVVEGLNILTRQAQENQPVLELIKDSLIKTSETIFVIKDTEGNVVTKFTAKPDAEGNLVVQFSSLMDEDIDDKSG